MAEAKRRLAAILSADVAGYSRLMGDDERATMDTLTAYRRVFRKHISDHDGRVVDTAGDSVLAVFNSVVEATQCSVDVQSELEGCNADLPEDRQMQFRIGVNLGDVFEQDDGTIYGDGVNVAARLEGLAKPGGICLSGSAHEQVEGKIDLGFEDIGKHEVKNIARPLRAYRVVAQTPSEPEDPILSLPTGPSIAVLPFDNLSGDPEQGYFADGIAEEIITALTQFRDLFVIARNSSFQYKGRSVDVRAIGEELGVQYVLEGSVRRAADTIRVTAQLTETETGAHLWADTFDRDLTAGDIFALQDEITENVVGTIAEPYGVITRAGLKHTKHRSTESLGAYECVLRAREWYGATLPDLYPPARDCLERTIILDPGYAEAWAWLALLYNREFSRGMSGPAQPPPLDRALNAAQRAIKLEPDSAMAHYALASAYFFRHEIALFRREAETALSLNSNNAMVIAELGNSFGYLGEFDRSLAMIKKAMALNPHHPSWYYATIFNYHYHKGEYPEALVAAQNWNEPNFSWYQVHLAQAYALLGRREEAQVAVAKLLELKPDFAKRAREEFMTWITEEMIAHELNGLRKAGLDIPDEPAAHE